MQLWLKQDNPFTSSDREICLMITDDAAGDADDDVDKGNTYDKCSSQ